MFIFVEILCFLLQVYFKATDPFNERWQSAWIITAFWDVLAFALLCVICYLWAPSQNSQRYVVVSRISNNWWSICVGIKMPNFLGRSSKESSISLLSNMYSHFQFSSFSFNTHQTPSWPLAWAKFDPKTACTVPRSLTNWINKYQLPMVKL